METRQKKILVPVDFTPSSDSALAMALLFAKLHRSEVVLLHAVEPAAPMAEFFADTDLHERKRAYATKLLDHMIATHTGEVTISRMLIDGKPYKAILQATTEIQPEMIVMGTWGTHAIESGMIGSNVNKVVRNAVIPVVTVTRANADTKIDRILVPVDPKFGIRELRAFLQYYRKSYQPHIELIAIAMHENEVDELQKYLNKQVGALHHQGMPDVSTHVRVGGIISESLLAYAKEGAFDMIWMETHGRKGLAGWLLGSVTEEVLQYSPIPVLSLHPEREPDHTYYYHSNFPI
jgi:nucleotide-binding universal stress UspA family protein